jgi:hypothetical protein
MLRDAARPLQGASRPSQGASRRLAWAFSIRFVKVMKIDIEEQSRNNSSLHGTFVEAQNVVWNGLNRLISSELCIKSGISGKRNHTGSQIGGFSTYLSRGQNAQINSLAEISALSGDNLKRPATGIRSKKTRSERVSIEWGCCGCQKHIHRCEHDRTNELECQGAVFSGQGACRKCGKNPVMKGPVLSQ